MSETIHAIGLPAALPASRAHPRRIGRTFDTGGERAAELSRVEHRLGELFLEALAWSDQTPPPRIPVWVAGRETAQAITTVVSLMGDANWFTAEVLAACRRDNVRNLRRSLLDCYVDANADAALADCWTGR